MALSPLYAVREVATSFKRNAMMTVAAILTMWVSLALIGGARLINQAASDASRQWRGGVEVSIFLRPDVTQQQVDAVGSQLKDMPEVKKVRYVDQQGAYKEFKALFANQPLFVQSVQATDLPPSYRVVPSKAEFVDSIGSRFQNFPGVYQVAYAKEFIDYLLKSTKRQENVLYLISAAVIIAAFVLTFTTIQMAIFARRREVAVMKLVGATNWFIRIPFMLEGLLEGLLGGALALVTVYLARNVFTGVGTIQVFNLHNSLYVTTAEALRTGVVLVIGGALMGAIGSAVAVRRFLSV
jgi:cell division transport system permease protein